MNVCKKSSLPFVLSIMCHQVWIVSLFRPSVPTSCCLQRSIYPATLLEHNRPLLVYQREGRDIAILPATSITMPLNLSVQEQ